MWVPYCVMVVLRGPENGPLLALAAAVFVAAMYAFNREASAMVRLALRHRRESELLAERLRTAEERARAIVETAAEAILEVGPDGRVLVANGAAGALLGLEPGALVGRPVLELVDGMAYPRPDERHAVAAHEAHLRHADGRDVAALVSVSPPLGDGARTVIARDISARKALERQLERDATHDALTGLPNRAAIMAAAEEAAADARASGTGYALVFIDLDLFKHINDGFGHSAGDELLRVVANRLRVAVKPLDTVGRYGGDEFVVLLRDVEEAAHAARVVERLLALFGRPVGLDGEIVHVTASAGIAWSPRGELDPERLLADADVAMYQAKDAGRGAARMGDPEDAARRRGVDRELRRAFAGGEIVAWGQPVVSLVDGRAVGLELLARWIGATGPVDAASFIGAAERSGLVVEIDRLMLREAAALVARLDSRFDVAANVSARSLPHGIAEDFADAIARAGADPARLVIEVTESAAMADMDEAVSVLATLRSLGAHVATDDFGTGHASLRYLDRLPATHVKIDREFASRAHDDPRAAAIVDALAGAAAAYGMAVVAEGIESAAAARRVRELGCTLGQGYHFGAPQPLDRITALLDADIRHAV